MRRTSDRGNLLFKSLAIVLVCAMLIPGIVVSAGNSYAEKGQEIGPGAYYRNMLFDTPNGKYVINMVEAVIGTEYLKIEASDSGKTITNQTVLSQALKKSGKDQRVISAVNGDFFDMTTIKGLPYSTSIIDGEIKAAVQNCSVFAISGDGSCAIESLSMNSSVGLGESSFPVTAVNKLRWNDQLVIYTPAFGTSTKNTQPGVDLVVSGVKPPLQANVQYTGTVAQVVNTADTPIPADSIVISGQGKGAQFLSGAAAGGEISFSISFDKENIRYAVGGFPRILENGQLAQEINQRGDALERHPRTIVGLKGDKLFMATIDGRHQGVSDGMTLYEVAEFLLGQGIEDAMNLDGGGSSTMVVRTQGKILPEVVNVPSDGKERAIGNTLQLISTAPVSQPEYIKFNTASVKIFTGSTFKPSYLVLDKYFNLVQQDFKEVKYLTDGKTAKVSKDGTYTSGKKAGSSYLEVAIGNIRGRLPVTIVDKVSRLEIANDFILLDPGEKVQLSLKAYDENGENIFIDPSAVKWSVAGGIGTVDAKGMFTAGKKLGSGKVSVKIGTVASELAAKTGKTPIVLSGFENLDNLATQTIKGTATAKLTAKGEPVKAGKGALKLEYKLGQGDNSGTSVVYTVFKEPLKVAGKPAEIGMWVYGDAGSHWLRGTYTNSLGEKKVVNFTKEGGLNWKGWKFVYTEIPEDEKFPIAINQVYLAEPQKDNKTGGKLYMDDLTALYKYYKDYYSPELAASFTSKTASFDKSPMEFYFDISEKGTGINKASIKLYLNNKLLSSKAITITKKDTDTYRVTYKVSKALSAGEYTIRLALKDNAGNTLNPEYSTKFVVNK